MGGRKIIFLLLFLAPILACGQGLERQGFNRLTLDGQKFSFKEASRFDVNPITVAELQRGLKMEKAAIGLGVSSVGFIATGLGMFLTGMFTKPDMVPGYVSRSRYDLGERIGIGFLAAGGAMAATSIALGSCGAVKIKKSIRGYNNSHIGLSTTIAPGGVGLALTF